MKFTTAAGPPRSQATQAAIGLVVALAAFAAPAAMARPHSAHSHLAASHVTKTVRDPGYARTDPVGPNWGSECVTDEGQGRFFPCDSGQ